MSPIEATKAGIFMLIRLIQSAKTWVSIKVRLLFGSNVTLTRFLQNIKGIIMALLMNRLSPL